MKKITVYQADDGREFATKEEVLAYESGSALVTYLTRVLPEATPGADINAIVEAIRADTEGLAEAIKPLLPKRTRATRGVKRGPRAGQRTAPRAA